MIVQYAVNWLLKIEVVLIFAKIASGKMTRYNMKTTMINLVPMVGYHSKNIKPNGNLKTTTKTTTAQKAVFY